ncbi:MAG: hypothetical protein MRK02_03945 [Candidatus Scalindua sp.]|nr:hypothetical protein [Candidatus Scalindua sp.]
MKNFCLSFSLLFSTLILQSCVTSEKNVKEDSVNRKAVEEDDLLKELEELKMLLGYRNTNREILDNDKHRQLVEFGMSLEKVADIFPASDKFEDKPFVNGKVTLLARDVSGGRFNFFFYDDKVYKVVLMKKWGNFSLRFAEDEINKFISVFLENYGKPDERKSDDTHQKMVWIAKEMQVMIEVFSLMSHSGVERVLTLVYADRNIAPLAKSSESFELYKTKREGILDQ